MSTDTYNRADSVLPYLVALLSKKRHSFSNATIHLDMLRRTIALIQQRDARIRELEANQRTPGTVEVCEKCGVHSTGEAWEHAAHDDIPWAECPQPKCPVRASALLHPKVGT